MTQANTEAGTEAVKTNPIVIAKGIPLPVRKVSALGTGRPTEYPWDKLEVGDSFPAKPTVTEKAFRSHAAKMAAELRKAQPEKLGRLHLVVGFTAPEDGTEPELRCWRAEDRDPAPKRVVKAKAPAEAGATTGQEAGAEAGAPEGAEAGASAAEAQTGEAGGQLPLDSGDGFNS